ncbi:MAG: hypothetical protein HC896_01125 [Bacteroidales bacterium]|nr:hypothetical protein [Bacteroidales bacterium]
MPNLKIGSNTFVEGQFMPDANHVAFHAKTDFLSLNNNDFINLDLHASLKDSVLLVESGSHSLTLKNGIILENLTVIAKGRNDSLNFTARWINWDTNIYKGAITAGLYFQEQPCCLFPKTIIDIKPTDITINDTTWHIGASRIVIDSSDVTFQQVSFYRKDQYFRVTGKISENPKEILNIKLSNFNLTNLGLLMATNSITLNGKLSANAQISNVYNNIQLEGLVNAEDFEFNGQNLGHTKLTAKWNSFFDRLKLEMTSTLGKATIIDAKGNYFLNTRELDIDVQINKLKLTVLHPFLSSVFSEMNGIASGDFTIKGFIDEPKINGDVLLDKASIGVDYLKTRYSYNGKVAFYNSDIIFDRVNVFDKQGNLTVCQWAKFTRVILKTMAWT